MVRGPAHGPRVDVLQLAACAKASALVTLAILKALLLVMPHRCRDGHGAVVPCRDEVQTSRNGGDEDNVDDGPRLGLVQPRLLRSALVRLPPPGGNVQCSSVPEADHNFDVYTKFSICLLNRQNRHE